MNSMTRKRYSLDWKAKWSVVIHGDCDIAITSRSSLKNAACESAPCTSENVGTISDRDRTWGICCLRQLPDLALSAHLVFAQRLHGVDLAV